MSWRSKSEHGWLPAPGGSRQYFLEHKGGNVKTPKSVPAIPGEMKWSRALAKNPNNRVIWVVEGIPEQGKTLNIGVRTRTVRAPLVEDGVTV